MEENEQKEYTWSGLFVVTTCSSILFNIFIKLMDDNFSNLLLIISGIGIFFSISNWAFRKLAREKYLIRKTRRFAS